MITRLLTLVLFIGLLSGPARAEELPVADSLKAVLAKAPADTNKVNTLLLLSKEYLLTSPEEAIAYNTQALELARKLNFGRGQAFALKNTGIVHYMHGDFVEALDFWERSLKQFEALNDQNGIANLLSNIGVIYFEHGEDDKALEYYLRSLKVAEKTQHKLRIATALINIGTIFGRKAETYQKSIDYFERALTLAEDIQDQGAIGTTTVNLGTAYLDKGDYPRALQYFQRSLKAYEGTAKVPMSLNRIGNVYSKQGNYPKALEYHTQALALARQFNTKLEIARSLLDIGGAYLQQGAADKALAAYKEGQQISTEINAFTKQHEANVRLAETYAELRDFQNAYKYHLLAADSRDSLFSIEADKKLAGLTFNFEIGKKEDQIKLLNKDKELQAAKMKRQKFAKNAFMVGMFLVLILAFAIYRNYRLKVKTNRLLDKQKVQIENLLLNILPAPVAAELQATGHAEPRFYDSVSVLFSDFKNFTVISEGLTPNELLDELSRFFTAFDNISEKYGLEKIKTIGDSYMCAGGIPIENTTHAEDIVRAALEIQEYMQQFNAERRLLGQVPWNLRIGINSGPVVAGVVGHKKYAYDIWGSTVNIASRMESNGEAGKVNISSATYELVKHLFPCTYRGRITAKSLGEVDMYFVGIHELEALTLQTQLNDTAELAGETVVLI